MKKIFATFCILGTAALLSACHTNGTTTYDSGANYATDRTAGEVDSAPVKTERVFRRVQTTK